MRDGLERCYDRRGDLCLCLSGGGFRAAAFHLGVVRWLSEQGFLQHVTGIRSVSGGSIVAAWMFRNEELLFSADGPSKAEFERGFAAPLREFLQSDIRTGPFIKTVGRNVVRKEPRCGRLTRRLDRLLCQGAEVVGRPATARRFTLVAFDIHSRELVELLACRNRLARQVVASAAFPPLIGPVALDGRKLVDGGLASNLGVTGSTLNEWLCVLVSDAGRPSPSWTRSSTVPMSLRLLPLLRDGSNRAFRSQISAANSDSTVVAVAPIAIDDWFGRSHGIAPLPSAARMARLRTDLAGFSAAKIVSLERMGHAVAAQLFARCLTTWSVRMTEEGSALSPETEALRNKLADWHAAASG